MLKFSITTRLLSTHSQDHLSEIYSLPFGVLPEQITFKSLTIRGKHPQEIVRILNQCVNNESHFKSKYQQILRDRQAYLKKLNQWVIGVGLITFLLVITTTLLVLFFPPTAVFISSLFIAIGKGYYGLLLIPGLPFLGLSIANRFGSYHNKKLESQLIQNNTVIRQLEQALHGMKDIVLELKSDPIPPPSSLIVTRVSQTTLATPRRNSNIFTPAKAINTVDVKKVNESYSITNRNSL